MTKVEDLDDGELRDLEAILGNMQFDYNFNTMTVKELYDEIYEECVKRRIIQA